MFFFVAVLTLRPLHYVHDVCADADSFRDENWAEADFLLVSQNGTVQEFPNKPQNFTGFTNEAQAMQVGPASAGCMEHGGEGRAGLGWAGRRWTRPNCCRSSVSGTPSHFR